MAFPLLRLTIRPSHAICLAFTKSVTRKLHTWHYLHIMYSAGIRRPVQQRGCSDFYWSNCLVDNLLGTTNAPTVTSVCNATGHRLANCYTSCALITQLSKCCCCVFEAVVVGTCDMDVSGHGLLDSCNISSAEVAIVTVVDCTCSLLYIIYLPTRFVHTLFP